MIDKNPKELPSRRSVLKLIGAAGIAPAVGAVSVSANSGSSVAYSDLSPTEKKAFKKSVDEGTYQFERGELPSVFKSNDSVTFQGKSYSLNLMYLRDETPSKIVPRPVSKDVPSEQVTHLSELSSKSREAFADALAGKGSEVPADFVRDSKKYISYSGTTFEKGLIYTDTGMKPTIVPEVNGGSN